MRNKTFIRKTFDEEKESIRRRLRTISIDNTEEVLEILYDIAVLGSLSARFRNLRRHFLSKEIISNLESLF